MVAAEGDERAGRASNTLKLVREAPKTVPTDAFEEALRVLPALYRHKGTHVQMRGVRGAPDWLGYEMQVWELGEATREYLRANRKARGKCAVLDAVADVVSDSDFGKGRQSFVVVLAQYGGLPYAQAIAECLGDPDVLGHAVKALAKLRVPGYSAQIRDILQRSKSGWIRAAARRYLDAVRGAVGTGLSARPPHRSVRAAVGIEVRRTQL